MSDTRSSTTKTLFVFVIIVAVIAGIYVLKMNEVNNLLGIGAPAPIAATAPPAKSASDTTLVPGGTPTAPAETPAAAGSSATPTPPTATTPDSPAPASQTTAPADNKAPGKKTTG